MSDEDKIASDARALYAIPTRAEGRATLRKKILTLGPATLTNVELLTLISGSANQKIVRELLSDRRLTAVADTTLSKLVETHSIDMAGAARIVAAFELHRRVQREFSQDLPRINRPQQVYQEVRDIRHLKKEHLVGLYLDAQNYLIHRETISIGSLNMTRTHPREILYPAIQYSALGFILAHNHPSGRPEPSKEDITFTSGVVNACDLMGIEMFDHIIVSAKGFVSLRERGCIRL